MRRTTELPAEVYRHLHSMSTTNSRTRRLRNLFDWNADAIAIKLFHDWEAPS
jgi:hypothetical protein